MLPTPPPVFLQGSATPPPDFLSQFYPNAAPLLAHSVCPTALGTCPERQWYPPPSDFLSQLHATAPPLLARPGSPTAVRLAIFGNCTGVTRN
ncbi:hypothetical protein T484DRAFT_2490289 [Baffinella frigidus]|nr:hypothetical protein T484DRAFT_2490289 [Cryptophyta sp. CCMP2293]